MRYSLEQWSGGWNGHWHQVALFETELGAYVGKVQAIKIAPGLYRITALTQRLGANCEENTMKPGTYVIDTSASGRYYTAVYCVEGQSYDRTIVRYVGDVVNGRIQYTRDRVITHRDTKNLREYQS